MTFLVKVLVTLAILCRMTELCIVAAKIVNHESGKTKIETAAGKPFLSPAEDQQEAIEGSLVGKRSSTSQLRNMESRTPGDAQHQVSPESGGSASGSVRKLSKDMVDDLLGTPSKDKAVKGKAGEIPSKVRSIICFLLDSTKRLPACTR
jgi:hypothetical protein